MAFVKIRSVCIVVSLCLLTLTAHGQSGNQPPRYTFGIVPQQSSSELVRAWASILGYLGKKTGVTLDFDTAKIFRRSSSAP